MLVPNDHYPMISRLHLFGGFSKDTTEDGTLAYEGLDLQTDLWDNERLNCANVEDRAGHLFKLHAKDTFICQFVFTFFFDTLSLASSVASISCLLRFHHRTRLCFGQVIDLHLWR